MSDTKYKMFKNFMHNELGISRDDIQEWTKEAVKSIAREYLERQMSEYTVRDHIRELFISDPMFGSPSLTLDIKKAVAKELAANFEVAISRKETTGE